MINVKARSDAAFFTPVLQEIPEPGAFRLNGNFVGTRRRYRPFFETLIGCLGHFSTLRVQQNVTVFIHVFQNLSTDFVKNLKKIPLRQSLLRRN